MRDVISTDQAPKAIGLTRSHSGRGLHIYFGADPGRSATQQVVAGDVAAQTDRVLKNVAASLRLPAAAWRKSCAARCFSKAWETSQP